MGREAKKVSNGEPDPEADERKRLTKLAISNNLVSETPAKGFVPLEPSKIVAKHHGKDILKKSQRKNRYLFSFPGLLGPIGGGKIGELTNLGSKNPILYLEFPQGRMKLFGTIVYPKNRYLTIQYSKGGKNVICDDCFDTVILFSDACWVGRKDENPDEIRLDMPAELYEAKHSEYDFQGGAGATPVNNHNHDFDREVESPEPKNKLKATETTPVRQSGRTAGKTFKFAEASSSGDDSAESVSEMEEEIKEEADKTHTSSSIGLATEQITQSAVSETMTMTKGSHGSLVQATISTLFKKVEEKKSARDTGNRTPPQKDSKDKLQKNSSKRKTEIAKAGEPRKKQKISLDEGTRPRSARKTKEAEVEDADDDIEEFSSASGSEDSHGSDEDWNA